jgi:glycerol-3-phosphate acyltransferase PlsY
MEFFLEKTWLLYVLAGLFGYLVGSVSVFRIVHRFLKKKYKDDSTESVESDRDKTDKPPVYSASVLGTDYGKKYGCITSVLDMLKVALPTLAVRLLFPDHDFYLATALLAIMGNSYPVYYKFKGGAGYSAILGAVFVINWFGVFVAHAAATVLGYLLGSVLIMRAAGNILYIFWFWIYFNDIKYVGFIILANIIFWIATTRHIRGLVELKEETDEERNQEYMSKKLLMGAGFGRFIDNYGFPALLKKLFRK